MTGQTEAVLDDEIQDLAGQIAQRLGLRYGQVTLKVKDQRVVAMEVSHSYHTQPRP